MDEDPASLNVGSLEKRSNQPKYKETKNEKSKDYCKADLKQRVLFFINIVIKNNTRCFKSDLQ